MKIFKYISLLFLGLIISFFAIGLFAPAIKFENAITVDAPIEKAFTLFTDTTKMNTWVPGFVSFSNDSGGNMAPGSKWNLVLLQDGQRYEMTETMTGFIPNKQYSYLLENSVLHNQVDVIFKPIGGKTGIISHNLLKGNSIIWRSILFFYEKDFHDRGQKTYDDLKKMIESQP